MRFYFRPMPFLTVATAILLAVLVWLGVWQIHRLHWKLGLIAQVNHSLTLPPISLDQALAMGAGAQYRHVALDGHFENAKEAYVFGTGPEGEPVYHVLVPFLTTDGRTLIVDRGIVPAALLDPARRAAGQLSGTRHVVGVWRVPDAPGFFTPKPDLAHRIWYSREVVAISRTDGVKVAAPVVVEADASPNPGGWPRGGQTRVTFRNEHLQYALTWFLMAAALFVVYVAYHISRRRLGLGKAP
ncbi:MAG: SURF1 family protein [Alphaproteobacteria bacterium]|nr:SURF1 family protein [Alphaproteobacteria bacterium]